MRDALRRLIAFAAGVLVEGHQAEGIFDFATGSRFPVSGKVEDDTLDLTDETDGARLSGTLPDLRTADGARVTLEIDDDEFEGVDTATGARVHGRVSGRNIDLHDDQTGDSYTFCL